MFFYSLHPGCFAILCSALNLGIRYFLCLFFGSSLVSGELSVVAQIIFEKKKKRTLPLYQMSYTPANYLYHMNNFHSFSSTAHQLL